MSTETGDKAVVKGMVDQAKALVAEGRREAEQLQFADPLTADELFDAKERLGGFAGSVSIVREAQAARKSNGGRKKGSRNRRTADFAKYLLSFGQHPAVTLMQIQSTPPEEMVLRSQLIDTPKRQMSLADAQSLRVRCAEAILPYIEGKKPVAVELSMEGDFNLLVPGLNITPEDAAKVAAGTFIPYAEFDELLDDDGEGGA